MFFPLKNELIDTIKKNNQDVHNLANNPQPYQGDWLVLNNSDITYLSDNRIQVPSSLGGLFNIGDKIRIEQTTTKYFYVIGNTGTVLTINGGDTYTFDNTAFTEVSLSKNAYPPGFPVLMSYVPTIYKADGSGMTESPDTANLASYSMIGGQVTLKVTIIDTTFDGGYNVVIVGTPFESIGSTSSADYFYSGVLGVHYFADWSSIASPYQGVGIILTRADSVAWGAGDFSVFFTMINFL